MNTKQSIVNSEIDNETTTTTTTTNTNSALSSTIVFDSNIINQVFASSSSSSSINTIGTISTNDEDDYDYDDELSIRHIHINVEEVNDDNTIDLNAKNCYRNGTDSFENDSITVTTTDDKLRWMFETEMIKLYPNFTKKSHATTNLITTTSTTNVSESHQSFQLPKSTKILYKYNGLVIDDKEINFGGYGKVFKVVRNEVIKNDNGEFESNKKEKKEEGNMSKSTIFHIDNKQTNMFALKLIDINRLTTKYREKFIYRELYALLRLGTHSNLCQIFDIFKSTFVHPIDGEISLFNILMEYCPSGDMFDYLATRRFVPESHARHWFGQLLSAVAFIHSHGIAHRDLKLENLLLDQWYNLKVIDFGLCCTNIYHRSSHYNSSSANLNCIEQRSHTYCGSFSYSSPELLLNKPYLPTLADVWSCGVILYCLLFGTFPFTDEQLNSGQYYCYNWIRMPSTNNQTTITISFECVQVLKHIFVHEPQRYTIEQLLHEFEWCNVPLITTQNDELDFLPKFSTQEELTYYFERLNLPSEDTLSFGFEAKSDNDDVESAG